MSRKNILILGIIILLLLIAIGAYFFFKKPGVVGQSGSEFPSGSGSGGGGGFVDDEDDSNILFVPGSGQMPPKLYELHKVPVGGVGIHQTGEGEQERFSARYIERALGHIYETPLETYMESRILNETRSRINEALWGNNAQSVAIRSLDPEDLNRIKTSIVNLGETTQEIVGEAYVFSTDSTEITLPDGIPFLATAEDGTNKLVYLESDSTRAQATAMTFQNGEPSIIFDSIFTEWLPQLPNNNLATLTTRPSTNVPGHLFFVTPSTKALTKVVGGINGLTTLTNPTGTRVLYSASDAEEKSSRLYSYNIAKKESLDLGMKTLSEKCVWSRVEEEVAYCAVPKELPPANYPDQWYQGFVSFSDDIWKLDTETGTAEKILDPSVFEAKDLDITNPSMSSGDRYMVFMNKNTGTPWVYRLIDELPPAQTSEPISQTSEPTTQEVSTGATSSTTEGMTQVR